MEQQQRSNDGQQFQNFLDFLAALKIPNLLEEQGPVEAAPAPVVPGEEVEPEPVVPTEETDSSGVVKTFNDQKRVLSIKKKQREAKQNLRDRKKSSQMAGLNPLGIKSGLNIPMV